MMKEIRRWREMTDEEKKMVLDVLSHIDQVLSNESASPAAFALWSILSAQRGPDHDARASTWQEEEEVLQAKHDSTAKIRSAAFLLAFSGRTIGRIVPVDVSTSREEPNWEKIEKVAGYHFSSHAMRAVGVLKDLGLWPENRVEEVAP